MPEFAIVLDRLRSENLRGPTSALPRPQLANSHSSPSSPSTIAGKIRAQPPNSPLTDTIIATASQSPLMTTVAMSWDIIMDQDFEDLDKDDPRWFDLFSYFFLLNPAPDQDDLLFFVKRPPSSPGKYSADKDRIFVRRKEGPEMPLLPDIVCWKQTFFLNIVTQTTALLTVSVCSRTASKTMRCLRRKFKTVYASPYKSLISSGSAKSHSECSFPLIYYCINDFESSDLFLDILPGEFLCVEEILWIFHKILGCNRALTTHTELALMHPPLAQFEMDIETLHSTEPFPIPSSLSPSASVSAPSTEAKPPVKTVLFQGAVPHSSLLKVYSEKAISSASPSSSIHFSQAAAAIATGFSKFMSNIRGKSSAMFDDDGPDSKSGNSISSDVSLEPTMEREKFEYILMRGPQGKGQCQVSITSAAPFPTPTTIPTPPIALESTLTEAMPKSSSLLATRLSQLSIQKSSFKPPNIVIPPETPLKCSLTYVNVPWQSIVHDILVWDQQRLSCLLLNTHNSPSVNGDQAPAATI